MAAPSPALRAEAADLYALAQLRGPVTPDAVLQLLCALGLPLIPSERAHVRRRLRHYASGCSITLEEVLALVEEFASCGARAAGEAKAALRAWDALPARPPPGERPVITSTAALCGLLSVPGAELTAQETRMLHLAIDASGSRMGDTVDTIAVVDMLEAAAGWGKGAPGLVATRGLMPEARAPT